LTFEIFRIQCSHERRRKLAQRRDGLSTRALVLEAAGRIFAEKGYQEATTREICQMAGANSAAVNYYFGSKEGLYDEVLAEAHRQIVSLEQMESVVKSSLSAEEKLRAIFSLVLHAAANAQESWGVKVILREIAFPSGSLPDSLRKEIMPKAALMRDLIGQAAGVSGGSAEAARAAFLVMSPCAFLIFFSKVFRSGIAPDMTDADGLRESMISYAMGGLSALGRQQGYGAERGSGTA